MKRKAIIIPIAILIAGFVLMRVLIGFRSEPLKRKPVSKTKIVNTEVVSLNNVSAVILAYGRLASAQPVVIYSEVAGTLLEGNVPFQPGQSFTKGDLLLKIDDRQIKLDLNSARSDLLTALASVLPEIKVDFPDEFQTWQNYFNSCGFDKPVPPIPEVNNQKIKLYLSRFNVYKLYFSAKNLEIILNKHYIYAPFNGSIISANLRPASTARNGTLLGEIINLENMEVEVPVTASDIQWIDSSSPVTFTSSEVSGEWTGKIKRIGKNINEKTQSVPVYMTVNKNGEEQLYNGVFLQAKIPGKIIPNAYAFTRRALYNQKYVYRIKNGKLDYHQVEIARKETDRVIVNHGLQEGDTIVVELMQGIADGMPAKAKISGEEEDEF